MAAIIEIEPTGTGYRVWHHGEILCDGVQTPFFDAAWVLSRKGITGPLRMKRRGRDQIDMHGLIATAAPKASAKVKKAGRTEAAPVPHAQAPSGAGAGGGVQ